jgi:hypothetical protein
MSMARASTSSGPRRTKSNKAWAPGRRRRDPSGIIAVVRVLSTSASKARPRVLCRRSTGAVEDRPTLRFGFMSLG